MPSGYPYSKSVRPELFDQLCGGGPLRQAAPDARCASEQACGVS